VETATHGVFGLILESVAMSKRLREFVDKDHAVADAFYELDERHGGRNTESIKRKLKQLIKKDPDYLDPYLRLFSILQYEDDFAEADRTLDDAYRRALRLITDKAGNWPDVLEWLWLENRHIIRTIFNKAVSLWQKRDVAGALDLLRRLLKTNPGDNVGARDYILAIRMNMTFEQFEDRFNKAGFHDNEMSDWFDKNSRKFPDEFGWWEKAVEKLM
jgi:tetratricopeptide (TPR) repeat protein